MDERDSSTPNEDSWHSTYGNLCKKHQAPFPIFGTYNILMYSHQIWYWGSLRLGYICLHSFIKNICLDPNYTQFFVTFCYFASNCWHFVMLLTVTSIVNKAQPVLYTRVVVNRPVNPTTTCPPPYIGTVLFVCCSMHNAQSMVVLVDDWSHTLRSMLGI